MHLPCAIFSRSCFFLTKFLICRYGCTVGKFSAFFPRYIYRGKIFLMFPTITFCFYKLILEISRYKIMLPRKHTQTSTIIIFFKYDFIRDLRVRILNYFSPKKKYQKIHKFDFISRNQLKIFKPLLYHTKIKI